MDLGTKLFRSVLLALAGNRPMEKAALRYGWRLGAKRFVAGLTKEEALNQVRDWHDRKLWITWDHLGESVTSLKEAMAYKEEYVRLAASLGQLDWNSGLSVKPTQMGLMLSRDQCYENIRSIAHEAQKNGLTLTVDMESSACISDTLQIVNRLQREGYRQVGTVVQAYLYRTEDDLKQLTSEGVRLRLVKGAYKEPKSIAYPDKKEVDEQFRKHIEYRLKSGVYTEVATHDEKIVDWVKERLPSWGIGKDQFEFQMLYGVKSAQQLRLAQEGYRIRCYVPYGRQWYPYFVRRLAERPANLWFVLKNMGSK